MMDKWCEDLSQLSKHLRKDEKVLWSGKPVKTPFIFTGLMTIPLGLLIIIFSIYLMWTAASTKVSWFSILNRLIFLLVALVVFLGLPVAQVMRYRNTEYMITDQRIITQTGAIGVDTRFVDLDKVQEVYVNVGFIDKIFGTGSMIAVTAGFVPVSTTSSARARPSLAALKDPYKVHQLLQEALKKKHVR